MMGEIQDHLLLLSHSKFKNMQRGNTSSKTTKDKIGPKAPSKSIGATSSVSFLMGKRNFMFMGIGLVFLVLGFILMLGGGMPDPDTWDESLIYSHRRITLAPILILIGLGIQIYAIFTKSE
jgi:hypothetical protein